MGQAAQQSLSPAQGEQGPAVRLCWESPETGLPGWSQGPKALCGVDVLSMKLEWGWGGDPEKLQRGSLED